MVEKKVVEKFSERFSVLVVDANRDLDRILKAQLEQAGTEIEVLSVTNPDKGWRIFNEKSEEINLIIVGTCIVNRKGKTQIETIPFVKKVRESSNVVMAAMSIIRSHRKSLTDAGCNLELREKKNLHKLILSYLG